MRNLHTQTLVDKPYLPAGYSPMPNSRIPDSAKLPIANTLAKPDTHFAYSQKSRSCVMFDNAKQSIMFISQQARVVQHLIQQFQLYVGYREQLVRENSLSTNKHAWGVYLMYVQAVQDAMKGSYRGKALFGDGVSPPVRLHFQGKERVEPFDLPDPCLSAMISIRSFLAGVSDHNLPSVELGNACMVELFNALGEIQLGREKLTILSAELSRSRTAQPSGSQLGNIVRGRALGNRSWFLSVREKLVSLFDSRRPSAVSA